MNFGSVIGQLIDDLNTPRRVVPSKRVFNGSGVIEVGRWEVNDVRELGEDRDRMMCDRLENVIAIHLESDIVKSIGKRVDETDVEGFADALTAEQHSIREATLISTREGVG